MQGLQLLTCHKKTTVKQEILVASTFSGLGNEKNWQRLT